MEKKGWKAELTDVLGRCVQSQDKNLWIANILNLVEQELDRAREEGYEECKKDFAVSVGLATDTEFSKIVGKIASKLTTK